MTKAKVRATALVDSELQRSQLTVVDGLFAIAKALDGVAHAIHRLGNADACTPMGAIEAYGQHMGEKMDGLIDAIREIAGR
jgi:hypothetical protein